MTAPHLRPAIITLADVWGEVRGLRGDLGIVLQRLAVIDEHRSQMRREVDQMWTHIRALEAFRWRALGGISLLIMLAGFIDAWASLRLHL